MCSKVSIGEKVPIYIYIYSIMTSAINPLHPNIKMHILHTVFYTFPKVVVRRICLSCWDHFLYSCCVIVCDSGMQILKGEIRF